MKPLEKKYSAQREHAVSARRTRHILHVHVLETDARQIERADVLFRQKSAQDPEKEAMKRELADLRAAVENITQYLRQVDVQQSPNVSFLDEMLASLSLKESVVPDVTIPQSLVDALSSSD